MPQKGKEGPFSQIVVAVAIALIAGGTAPWWWGEVKRLIPGTQDRVSEQNLSRGSVASSDPETTVRTLLTAWSGRDREAALKVAARGVVDKLFSASSLKVNSKELTCYPAGTGQRDCQMPHTEGMMVLRLRETDQGWWVEAVGY